MSTIERLAALEVLTASLLLRVQALETEVATATATVGLFVNSVSGLELSHGTLAVISEQNTQAIVQLGARVSALETV